MFLILLYYVINSNSLIFKNNCNRITRLKTISNKYLNHDNLKNSNSFIETLIDDVDLKNSNQKLNGINDITDINFELNVKINILKSCITDLHYDQQLFIIHKYIIDTINELFIIPNNSSYTLSNKKEYLMIHGYIYNDLSNDNYNLYYCCDKLNDLDINNINKIFDFLSNGLNVNMLLLADDCIKNDKHVLKNIKKYINGKLNHINNHINLITNKYLKNIINYKFNMINYVEYDINNISPNFINMLISQIILIKYISNYEIYLLYKKYNVSSFTNFNDKLCTKINNYTVKFINTINSLNK